MKNKRRGYTNIGRSGTSAVTTRPTRERTTIRPTKAKASPIAQKQHTAAVPVAAHKMVSHTDSHRVDGTVRAKRSNELLGHVLDEPMGDYGRRIIDLQSAWDRQQDANVFRKSGHTHLSDLMGKCHRMLAIIKRYDLYPAPKRLFDQEIVVFAQGNMLHDEARRRFASQIPNHFYGFWRCACGAKCEEGTLTSVKGIVCDTCNTDLDTYVELRVIMEDVNVGHSIDGLLLYPNGALAVVEIKSCTKELFEAHIERGTPAMEHVGQAASYWRALRSAGYDVISTVFVVYVCKEYVSPSQSVILEAKVNEATVRTAVDPYFSDIHLINEIDFKAPLPPRQNNCVDCGKGGSTYCPAAALCFLLPESGEWNGSVKIIGEV